MNEQLDAATASHMTRATKMLITDACAPTIVGDRDVIITGRWFETMRENVEAASALVGVGADVIALRFRRGLERLGPLDAAVVAPIDGRIAAWACHLWSPRGGGSIRLVPDIGGTHFGYYGRRLTRREGAATDEGGVERARRRIRRLAASLAAEPQSSSEDAATGSAD